MNEMFS